MRLCFSTLSCPSWSLEEMIDAARNSGIEGIDFRGIGEEIDITRLPQFNEDLDATLALLHHNRIELPCFNTSVTLVTPAPERWQMMLDECQRYARLAERTGTPYIRVFGGAAPKGIERDEARALARRHLRQLVKVCAGHPCQVLLESHDEWSTSSQVMELTEPFAPDEVGVLWDIEHSCRRGEAPQQTAERLRSYIRHVHVKDSVKTDGKPTPKILGEGDLPLRDTVTALKSMGYDGWLCLETEKRWHAEAPEPEVTIPNFATVMRRLWNE